MENKGKLIRTVILGISLVAIIVGIFTLFANAVDLTTYTSMVNTGGNRTLYDSETSMLTIQSIAAGIMSAGGIFSVIALAVTVLSLILKPKAIGIVSLVVNIFVVLLFIIFIGVINGSVNGFYNATISEPGDPIYVLGDSGRVYTLGAATLQVALPQMVYFIIVAVLQIVSLIVDKPQAEIAKADGNTEPVESKTVEAAVVQENVCPKCGSKLAEDALFCGECGTKVIADNK